MQTNVNITHVCVHRAKNATFYKFYLPNHRLFITFAYNNPTTPSFVHIYNKV